MRKKLATTRLSYNIRLKIIIYNKLSKRKREDLFIRRIKFKNSQNNKFSIINGVRPFLRLLQQSEVFTKFEKTKEL